MHAERPTIDGATLASYQLCLCTSRPKLILGICRIEDPKLILGICRIEDSVAQDESRMFAFIPCLYVCAMAPCAWTMMRSSTPIPATSCAPAPLQHCCCCTPKHRGGVHDICGLGAAGICRGRVGRRNVSGNTFLFPGFTCLIEPLGVIVVSSRATSPLLPSASPKTRLPSVRAGIAGAGAGGTYCV